jgi:hypothetical protein
MLLRLSELPIRTVNESNLREHWSKKAERAKSQRQQVKLYLLSRPRPMLPCTVKLTRLSPMKLDTDGLARSQKAVRDEIARWIGVDDSPDSGVTWLYDQEVRPIWLKTFTRKGRMMRTADIRLTIEVWSA